jgi:EAL domain-containing protein (putative c-di-GMP-specific phosphodiesterase class I)
MVTLIDELRERGHRVALDHLGGQSWGLQALARLSPDFVKLDPILIRGAASDPRTVRFLRHILSFAEDEGIGVVAEGVETPGEREIMHELGCELMQGYLFGKPQPAHSR